MFRYDKDKLKSTMEKYLGTGTWKEVYDGAPSDASREYLKMAFYKSDNDEPNGDDYRELKEAIYRKLGIEDWKYLYKVFPGPFRKVCNQKIRELSE